MMDDDDDDGGDDDDTCAGICPIRFAHSMFVGSFPSIPISLSLERSALQQLVWMQQLQRTPVECLILHSSVIRFEQPYVNVSY